MREIIESELRILGGLTDKLPEILCAEHHASHAASAFYPSGLERAAVLCLDGVGEWATTSAWAGDGHALRLLGQIPFPHSLGLLYSAVTYHAGFRVNSGEYKLMGLAPYGELSYVKAIRDNLIDIREDGSFRLNLEYFDYCVGSAMTSEAFCSLFGGPHRFPESQITKRELDLAASIQVVIEDAVVRLARSIGRDTGFSSLCMAGGVALNCVANTEVLRKAGFERVWVQPASGDAGAALGAALLGLFERGGSLNHPRGEDAMSGALIGPSFTDDEIRGYLSGVGARFKKGLDQDSLLDQTAEALAVGQVVGWFQGRAEFGPRALGARSILADPRDPGMQRRLNHKVKYREDFRPFAPSVLLEHAEEYFEMNAPSPYMQFVANVRNKRPCAETVEPSAVTDLQKRLSIPRSEVPAVTHVDGTARLQTVNTSVNPLFYALLRRFAAITGCAVLINTSFNVRGEPIVGTPEDAYRCFMRTDMDLLVIGSFVLRKGDNCVITKGSDSEHYKLDTEAAGDGVSVGTQGEAIRAHPSKSHLFRRVTSGIAAGVFLCGVSGLFVGVVTPIACWRRLCGRDKVWLRRDPDLQTYWQRAGIGGRASVVAGVRPLASTREELAALRKGNNSLLIGLLALLEPLARTEPKVTEPPLAIYTMF